MRLSSFTFTLIVLHCILSSQIGFCSNDYTEIYNWVKKEHISEEPKAGTTLTNSDISIIEKWIPPKMIEEFKFPQLKLNIQETKVEQPHSSFVIATQKWANTATIDTDGSLKNYKAGQPFSDEQIKTAPSKIGGFMIGWNNIHRWQHFGYKIDIITMAYVSGSGDDGPLNENEGLLGGGKLDRLLSQSYHRVYLNKLAMLPQNEYKVNLKDSTTRFYKDFMEFLDPRDVKGTKFVVERMLDPHADDQVNTYLPTERRVRRFSAKERADSFMGSNVTLDDFEGFSGRVLDYHWSYIGSRKILAVSNMEEDLISVYGPNSRALKHSYQIRDCYVVEVKSIWEGHPYKSRILFVDKQTFNIPVSLIFDHEDALWKVMQTVTSSPHSIKEITESVPSWRGQITVDLKANNATVVRAKTPTLHPVMEPKEIKRVFAVSTLTEGR
ncbi:MAG: DUF1329 domain-containing protein [Pseudomonadota bacterium]|nr:DUF1329 domain-containing protein [Pseudomonadota bacterium]